MATKRLLLAAGGTGGHMFPAQALAETLTAQPNIVVGFGGYPSFPAVKAAQAMNIPTVLHEQNAVLGRVNRLLAPGAKYVATGFQRCDKAPAGANLIFTGNPLRRQILDAVPKIYAAPQTQMDEDIHRAFAASAAQPPCCCAANAQRISGRRAGEL